jgi:hypothetical protein
MTYYTLHVADNWSSESTVYYTQYKELVEVLVEVSEKEYKEPLNFIQGESIEADNFKGRMLEDYFLELAERWEGDLYHYLINTYDEVIPYENK